MIPIGDASRPRIFPVATLGIVGINVYAFVRERGAADVDKYFVIGVWALVQFMYGFGGSRVLSERGGGVAYFAHIGGFLAGVFLITWFGVGAPRARRYRV